MERHPAQTKRAIRRWPRRTSPRSLEQSLRKNWKARNTQGGSVGEKFDPFQRVGVYIPGAPPLASTTLMTVTLAKAAGCPEIVACTPCDKNGEVNPDLLAALDQAGAAGVYRVGGATGDRRAGLRYEDHSTGAKNLRPRQCLRRGSQATAVRSRVHRPVTRPKRAVRAG